jgi:hypothetical protein
MARGWGVEALKGLVGQPLRLPAQALRGPYNWGHLRIPKKCFESACAERFPDLNDFVLGRISAPAMGEITRKDPAMLSQGYATVFLGFTRNGFDEIDTNG